jgi:hypothetical protein
MVRSEGLMPGPEPTYENKAVKQKAYRERNRERLRTQREEVAQLRHLAEAVHLSVGVAAAAGNEIAMRIRRASVLETLAAVAEHFQAEAGDAGL